MSNDGLLLIYLFMDVNDYSWNSEDTFNDSAVESYHYILPNAESCELCQKEPALCIFYDAQCVCN